MALTLLDVALAFLAVYLLKLAVQARSRPTYSLPPGPRGLPIVGNILDMPSEKEWQTFFRWGRIYGDICSIKIFGRVFIILNSAELANELLDKRSSRYSDRPVMQMGGELCGWKDALVCVPYGERFRRYRRFFHQVIGTRSSMMQFKPAHDIETKRFLRRVLAAPDALSDHIRKTAGAVILRISHGYEVKEQNDPFVELADKAVEQFALSTAPGSFLVNLIPWLSEVPEWVPGAGFKVTARSWKATLYEMVDRPYNFVIQQLAAGTAIPSYTSNLLASKDLTVDDEHDIKWSAASLYSGGADTTVSAIYSFYLAMALFPDVAKKAQEELDSLLQMKRLPSLEDRDDLPYVDALTKEILRWNSVTPTGVPHRATEDDIFNGYFIPKGAVIMTNLWGMTHDPRVYADPMRFNPDRFLGPNPEPDPRKMCALLAYDSVFMSAAASLAVFDISKPVENGVVIEPVCDNTTGTISHPKAFKCTIRPRSEATIDLIQSEV
ncbi:cytochrome P450 [Fistulina hepatica ATCC 64428]|uniref:Cytochrome P450 n=1 Tax=Fistulina hepatica ATCC 64428 TaxID=1128425 RepID=A0A0D7A6F0_9AGAR|nr:cytochrome P450 [Fistulina hepatica ATCC 64428]